MKKLEAEEIEKEAESNGALEVSQGDHHPGNAPRCEGESCEVHVGFGNTARYKKWNTSKGIFCERCNSCTTKALALKKAKMIEDKIIASPSIRNDIVKQLDNKENGVPILVTTVYYTLKRIIDGKGESTAFKATHDNNTAKEIAHTLCWKLSRESIGVYPPNTETQNIEIIKKCPQFCNCNEALPDIDGASER